MPIEIQLKSEKKKGEYINNYFLFQRTSHPAVVCTWRIICFLLIYLINKLQWTYEQEGPQNKETCVTATVQQALLILVVI